MKAKWGQFMVSEVSDSTGSGFRIKEFRVLARQVHAIDTKSRGVCFGDLVYLLKDKNPGAISVFLL